MNKEEMVSLFEYLGKPAGQGLGGEIYYIAKKMNISVGVKYVKNRKYEGMVVCYPVDFLNIYFKYNQI
jgi:hypothetical protein